MSKNLKAYYGLPNKVIFCKKSLISNQRPSSEIEIEHSIKTKKKTHNIDANGISDSYKFSRIKKKIDYSEREKKLLKLLDKHRGKHGEFDCIVPGSGGKDSCMAAHLLKYKYGMNPLTVTWPPILYTNYGLKNFKNWLDTNKLDNISAKRNDALVRFLTKQSILNIFHPFQSWMIGQKVFPIKIALKYKIPLVFYGENEAEHGGSSLAENSSSISNKSRYTLNNIDKVFLGGLNIKNIITDTKFSLKDLEEYLPVKSENINDFPLEIHYLGYFIKWVPQEAFYYSVKHCGFKPRPFRTQGTYSKYNSIDDKIDDLHYYTTFLKFGIGRTTYDASQEIRNDHIDIHEAKKLVKKYDGEYPDRYVKEVLDYLDIRMHDFHLLCDKFRSPHLWKKYKKKWYLRHTANKDGFDD